MSQQEPIDLANSNHVEEPKPIMFLTTCIRNRVEGCAIRTLPVSFPMIAEALALTRIHTWLPQAHVNLQLLNVAECYKVTKNMYADILELVKKVPEANDRYGAMIKTELEFLSLLKFD